MTRVGQCPSCHTRYELDEEDIGHLLECECGEVLFACNAYALKAIQVVCDACQGQYDVDVEDAGETVECECGQRLVVPTVVLRKPIGTASELEPDGEEKESPHDSSRDVGALASLGVTAQPEVNGSNEGDVEKTTSSRSGSTRKKQISVGSWLGVAGVVVLLLVAIVMFMRRDDAIVAEKSTEAGPKPAVLKSAANVGPTNDADGRSEADAAIDSVGSIALEAGSDVAMGVGDERERSNAASAITMVDPQDLEADQTSASPSPGANASVTDRSRRTERDDSQSLSIPPAPLYALPKARSPRNRVPIIVEKQPFMSLLKAVEKGFDAYEETQELMVDSEQSKLPVDIEAYHLSLGKTIGLLLHVHDLANAARDQSQIVSIRYLLAYLFYNAGHLPEACIMGEAVARWGEKEEPATKEAAMIALAAAQEANEIHWGDPEGVGELYQMEAVVRLLARRWPDDPQLGLIWMNLAYLYEAFNRPEEAIAIYAMIPAGTPEYAGAQVASGLANWRLARQIALAGDGILDTEQRRLAQQQLKRGLRSIEKEDRPPSEQSIEVRLALAQIAMTSRKAEEAETWLLDSDYPVVDFIRISDEDENTKAVIVSESTAREIFDLLIAARRQFGDEAGSAEILQRMAETLDTSEVDVEARLLATVKRAVDRLKSEGQVTGDDVEYLSDLALPLMNDQDRVPTASLLWLGESWRLVGLQAADISTARQCAARAAELYGVAMLRTDFPAPSMQTARLRRIELLRQSGAVAESLKIIEEVLARTPNVFAMQIEAAESLQQLAVESGRPEDWAAAINGPSGFSAIWGWNKLVTSLYSARWADTGTETHVQQLLHAQYGSAKSNYLAARLTRDRAARRAQLAPVERALKTVLATMDPTNAWHARFSELLRSIDKAK